jgi:DNA primase
MGAVDEIKARLDIVDIISEYVPLKKAGRNYKGLCPFHSEKTPSFIVFPDSQSWHCFGACGTGGDVFTFTMKREGLEFGEALKLLARRAGVELAPRSEAIAAEEQRLELLRQINAAAATYFHNLLLHADEAARARDYLTRRAVNPDTSARFQLGYALNSWEALKTYLLDRGYNIKDIADAGLVIQREDGTGYYDRFRGRLMIPIRDQRGRAIGFGARALGDEAPKYLNSPQTPLFDKSSTLYGLDMATRAIREIGQVVIVEGYMDVLQAHQHGIANVVATMGTAVTEVHLRMLQRLTKTFILALDADVAGDQATLRGLDLARETLERDFVPVPTPEGLIRHESRLNADIRILTLPVGRDPDDVIRQGPEEWTRLVQTALPIVDYYFRALTADLDLDSARGKVTAVRRLVPILAEVGDPVEHTHYVQKLARLIRVDERTLAEQFRQERKRHIPKARQEGAEEEARLGPEYGLEAHCLATLLSRPDFLTRGEALVEQLELEPLSPEDFINAEHQAIFFAFRTALTEHGGGSLTMPEGFRESLGEALAVCYDALLARAGSGPPTTEEQLEKDLGDTILRLRRRKVQEWLQQVQALKEDAREAGDPRATEYDELVRSYSEALKRIDEALQMRSISGRRRLEEKTGVFITTVDAG